MRAKLGQYQDGEKHKFEATYAKSGCYKDKRTGKHKKTLLFTGIVDDKQRRCATHVWVPENKLSKYRLQEGTRYSFLARVGTYSRGGSGTDFHLRDLCQVVALS